MAFTIPLTIGWLKHRFYAGQRILYRRSPNYFIEKNAFLSPAKDSHNKQILCPICGFSFADFMTKEGWLIRTCSATGFNNIINNPKLNQWFAELPKAYK